MKIFLKISNKEKGVLIKFNSNSKFFFLILVQCIYISCKQFSINAEDFDYETQYVIYTHKK